MGNRIHVRIFLPVLAAVIILSVEAWFAFSLTSDWYVEYTAEKKLTELMTMIENEAGEQYGEHTELEEQTEAEERESSKALLQSVRKNIREGEWEAGLMVLNSKRKQIYTDSSVEDGELYQFFADMLELKEMPVKTTIKIEAGRGECLARLFEVEAVSKVRARYFIGYVYVPDMSVLLIQTRNLMILIAAVCLFLMGAVVWLTARSIAAPLEDLCRRVDRIGQGQSAPVNGNYSLLELEKLKKSFNRMEERLGEAEEQNMRFFQNVSHDLRTPLVAITGYAQGIQCGVMREPEKAAEIILSESLRMTNLVESILTISKLDNHELKLRMVSIELEEFLEAQLEVLRGMAGGKVLEFPESGAGITVMADPELLARILQNVISNCVRYAKRKVEVCLIREGVWAVVVVEDDGPGFMEKDLPHIFERFYQGEYGKFGIGLSIAQLGMEYMGGRIEAGNKKAPLHGAVYRLYFPGEA